MARRYQKNIFVYFAAIIVLLIFFNFLGVLGPVKYLTRKMLSPLTAGINSFGIQISDEYKIFNNREEFLSAYVNCENKLQNGTVAEAKAKMLEDENSELRKQLAFRQKNSIPMVSADVIGRGVDSAEKTIIIDGGEAMGIKVNQPVVVGGGILVGKIIKTEKDIAVARLINDSRSKVAATLLNKERSLGVVEGGYGISVRMGFIPRNEAVAIGDLIVTSGLEAEVPRGLLLGQVVAIENEAYQPFQKAVLSPAADLSRLVAVTVLISN